MIVLTDTDVLIDLALDRKPFSADATSVIAYIQTNNVEAFVAWHSISNFYYMTSSPMGKNLCREFIKDIFQFIKIAPVNTGDMVYAANLNMSDFEDAMQSAAAVSCKAEYIITRNVKYYKESPVPAIIPGDFLKLGAVSK